MSHPHDPTFEQCVTFNKLNTINKLLIYNREFVWFLMQRLNSSLTFFYILFLVYHFLGCYGLPLFVMVFCYAKIFITLATRAKINSGIQRLGSNTDIQMYEISKKSEFDSLKVSNNERNNSLRTDYNNDLLQTSDITNKLRANSMDLRKSNFFENSQNTKFIVNRIILKTKI